MFEIMTRTLFNYYISRTHHFVTYVVCYKNHILYNCYSTAVSPRPDVTVEHSWDVIQVSLVKYRHLCAALMTTSARNDFGTRYSSSANNHVWVLLVFTKLWVDLWAVLWHCVNGLPQGDGTEEVVACSWDGQTYFVNLSKEVVRFHFRENVAAFCAG